MTERLPVMKREVFLNILFLLLIWALTNLTGLVPDNLHLLLTFKLGI